MVALLSPAGFWPLFSLSLHPWALEEAQSSRLCTEQRGCDPYLEWEGSLWSPGEGPGLWYPQRASCTGAVFQARANLKAAGVLERRPRCSLFWGSSCLYASLEITQLLGNGWARVNTLSSTDVTPRPEPGPHRWDDVHLQPAPGCLVQAVPSSWGGPRPGDTRPKMLHWGHCRAGQPTLTCGAPLKDGLQKEASGNPRQWRTFTLIFIAHLKPR